MYKDMTYQRILQRALSKVSDEFDKRQGSIIFDAIAPICSELAQAYIELEEVLKEGFADTSSREYLIKRAKERGLKPFEATYCIVLAEFEGDIELIGGERFYTEDGLIFSYMGQMQDKYYKLKCEIAGIKGNMAYGDLIPIDNIDNLKRARIYKILTLANDEEETEKFRKRYFDSFKSQAFGGNRADYKEKIMLLNQKEEITNNGGIEASKIYRAPRGGGSVDIYILNSSYDVPSDELINIAQEEINPIDEDGEGVGIAPIGHYVTIKPVVAKTINIETRIELKPGYEIEDIKEHINRAIDNYLKELRRSWEESSNIIIRISYIESTILSVVGVADISNTKINGIAENLTLDEFSIPIRGDFNVA